MTKNIEDTYKVLDEIDHIRKRPGMYVGSIVQHTGDEWVYDENTNKMLYENLTYNPGLCKIFSEILDNSIDEHKRPGSTLSTIKVEIDRKSGLISVYDNGGIPVKIHKDVDEYVPTMIFSRLRAGSNFDDEDDQSLIGTNGVGSALCNVLSTKFTVSTCDGTNKLVQTFTDGMRHKTEPRITPSKSNHTKISFIPDYEYFGCSGLSDDDYKKILKRVVDCAGCNTNIRFYLNGESLRVRKFCDYIALYDPDAIVDEGTDWQIAVTNNTVAGSFNQISFVNSVDTYDGGTHVWYITDQITNRLREFFKKKHKVDIRPSDIRNHLTVFINANINRPMFSSQTKSKMISEVKDYKSEFKVSDRFINKILKSSVIQDVLDWVAAKEAAALAAKQRKLNKNQTKINPKTIAKLNDAVEKKKRDECILFLAEGDCLHEDTEVLVSTDSGLCPTRIRDVNIGDFVLSNDRIRQVLDKTLKVSKGIRFNYGDNKFIVMSATHRMMVYDTTRDEFIELPASEISPDNHKFIKSQLVDVGTVLDIHEVREINDEQYPLEILYGDYITQRCSKTHSYLVYDDDDMSYKMVVANELIPGQHYLPTR